MKNGYADVTINAKQTNDNTDLHVECHVDMTAADWVVIMGMVLRDMFCPEDRIALAAVLLLDEPAASIVESQRIDFTALQNLIEEKQDRQGQ